MEFSLEKSLEVLTNTPDVLMAVFNNISDEWTTSNEGENTWTAQQVIAHLIVCEQTNWLPRAKVFLSETKETLVAIDMKVHFGIAASHTTLNLLHQFRQLRESSLKEIKSFNLQNTDLLRTAIHPKLGEVYLYQLIAAWVTHDLTHLAQITRIMAKQNKEHVGGFQLFLNILKS